MQKLLRISGLDKPNHDQVVLLHLARRMKIRNRRQAVGRCFGTSLACAAAANRKGVHVSLIRWKVLNDREYADHWAIRFSETLALDLTSAQFDVHADVVQNIETYPDNFMEPMEYPFGLFAEVCANNSDLKQLTTKSMLGVYVRMFIHDIKSRQAGKIKWNILGVGVRFVKECASITARSLGDWARSRRKYIQERRENYDADHTAPAPLK